MSNSSVNKQINNLHFKYLFSIAYLNPEEQHVLLEEEKLFYKHVFENQDQLFIFGKRTKRLRGFVDYTNKLIQNIYRNYMNVFKEKILNINDDDLLYITDTLQTSLSSLSKTLETQLKPENQNQLEYINCVLICSCLLFLIRTTKRALFIFISQNTETLNNKFYIFKNVSYVIEYINKFIISIRESTEFQRKLYEEFNNTKQQLVSQQQHIDKLLNEYDNCILNMKYLEDSKTNLEKEHKTKLQSQHEQHQQEELKRKQEFEIALEKAYEEQNKIINEYESSINKLQNDFLKSNDELTNEISQLQSKLQQCREETDKMKNDPEFKKQIIQNAIEQSQNFKDLFSGITNLSVKFKALLDRWDKDIHNKQLILKKIHNHITNLDETKVTLFRSAIDVIYKVVKEPIVIPYQNINVGENFRFVAELINGIIKLNEIQIIEPNGDMEILFDSEDLYKILVLLFEDLSGAVRVVVRVKNNQESNEETIRNIVGGKRKSRNYVEEYTIKKKMKRTLMKGGSDPEFKNYYISLDKSRMRVILENLPDGKLFENENSVFGPFFAVHDSFGFTSTDVNVQSTEDDILKSIQFDTLKMMFEKDLESNEKPPALLLYTYGYSGSGKTYTLFGKLKSTNEQPKNGILWKIINQLTNNYDIKFETTTKCYGYLKPDTQNQQGIIFHNDTTNDYNVQVPVPRNIQNKPEKWSEYILSLLRNTNDVDSFIKTTSNNPESSRGFLILKIGLYKNNILKGYLGVIDMAGNEDPYDISASLCPTMDFTKMDKLIQSKLNVETISISDYDSLYELLQTYISEIITPSITASLLTSTLGYKKGLDDIKNDIKIHNNKSNNQVSLIPNIQGISYEFPLLNSLCNDIERLIIFLSTNTIPAKTNDTTWYPLDFRREGNAKVVSYQDQIIFTFTNKTITFFLSNVFLVEVIGLLRKKYSFSGYVSIDDIKKEIQLNGDVNKLTAMKIAYAEQTLRKGSYKEQIEIDYPSMHGMNYNIKNFFDKIKKHIIQRLRKFIDFDKPYFIPFSADGRIQNHSYNTIKRIIREGFYINKANAELIKYFDNKIQMLNEKSHKYKETSFKFTTNFDYVSRVNKSKTNKLKPKTTNSETKNTFTTMNGNAVSEYNTTLITLLTEMFPGNNKDILITCVRDDQEYGKVKGTLDTLKLVEDLKST